MTIESESPKAKLSINERFGIVYDSPEFKAGVLAYNNRTILKHDIKSRKLLVIRRLLSEGDIGVLDKENQKLLADFIDSALAGTPEAKRGRGRPHDDEINNIELMKSISELYNKLHFEDGLTIENTLQKLSDISRNIGKALGKKRIEQLCIEFNTNRQYYENRLYELYYEDKDDLKGQYYVLVGDTRYIDQISSLDDCRIKVFGDPDEINIDKDLHDHAIRKLAIKYNLKEADVEKRINWMEDGYDMDDYQEMLNNPLFKHLK